MSSRKPIESFSISTPPVPPSPPMKRPATETASAKVSTGPTTVVYPENRVVHRSQGQFQVTKVPMHHDLLQEGLLRKDKKAASFVTIGEPDIALYQSLPRAAQPTNRIRVINRFGEETTKVLEVK